MGETARLVRSQEQHIAKIPGIERKAEESRKVTVIMRDEIVVIRTRQEDATERLGRIEENNHPCTIKPVVMPRLERLERFVEVQAGRQEADAKTQVKVETIEATLTKAEREKKALGRTVYAIMATVILTALAGAATSVWFIRGLQSDLQLETQASENRDKIIDQRLKLLPTAQHMDETMPTRQDMRTLTKAVKQKTTRRDVLLGQYEVMTPRQRTKWCNLRQDDLPGQLRTLCKMQ